MISEIRAYFKSVVKECEPDLKAHKQYYTDLNIADSKLEETYFLKIGNFTSQRIDTSYTGTFDVILSIWKDGDKDIVTKLDKAYTNAIEIMSNIQDQKRIDQTGFIKSITSNGIENEPVENNDKAGKFTIQFTVLVGYNAN